MLAELAGLIHRLAARSKLATHMAIKAKHQCDAIIGARLGEPSLFASNGELRIIESVAPKSRFFVDVGANVGEWSLEFASRMQNARGLAFEPAPVTAAHLRTRLADYSDVEVIELAVSSSPGHATFYSEDNYGVRSSLARGHSSKAARPVTVTVSTLDNELSKRNVEFVDFVKIDAEGYDFHVMIGCRGYLERRRIAILQFEYSAGWIEAGSTLRRAYDFLHDLRYEVFLLRHAGLAKIDPYLLRRIFRWFQLYCMLSRRPTALGSYS